jgi:hypothetical protein
VIIVPAHRSDVTHFMCSGCKAVKDVSMLDLVAAKGPPEAILHDAYAAFWHEHRACGLKLEGDKP